ncbi:MAG: glycoside hydrolase family 20 zincin-like fold domain-containing protein [Acidobacteriota bacterium]
MKNALLIFCSFISLSIMLQARQKEILSVVPEPREYSFSNERFPVNSGSVQLSQFAREYEDLNLAIDELNLLTKARLNLTFSKQTVSKRKILIGIPDENVNFKAICRKYKILPEEKLGEEGYCLLINNESIIISANSRKGLFYGVQTLKQIFRGIKNNSFFVRGIRISDWPGLFCRAVMDDISRGPVPNMDFIKQQIRRLSEMKVNTLMYYIEHVVKTISHPEFAPPDGAYTCEEWKEISEYALKHNVSLAGSFQSFGHLNNILKTPQYAHLGECGTLISPVNPESYKFLEDIYTEMVPSFKTPYFNVNCDETFDLGKGASKQLVDSIGYSGTYYNHIMRLYEILTKLNMKVLMWGDVILEHKELLSRLPKDIIIATWTYDNLNSYSSYISPIKEAGFPFFVTPGILNSNRLYPNFKEAFGNIKGFIKAGMESGAMGEITTVWDDGGCALFSNDWYGVAYSADKAWNISSGDSAQFDSRFNEGLYGAENNKYTEAINKLCLLQDFESTDALNDRILFEKLIPDSGKKTRISESDWLKADSLCTTALEILNGCKVKDYSQDVEYLRFSIRLFKSLAKERLSLLKAAANYSKILDLARQDHSGAEKLMLETICLAEDLINREIFLKDNYEKLWLNENRTYSLNQILEKFSEKIEYYSDLKDGLNESKILLDNSMPLWDKNNVRLGITPAKGKYFREWLIVNPFKIADSLNPSNIDCLIQSGGEMMAIPKVTEEFYFDSLKHRWSRVISVYQDIVNLSEIFSASAPQAVTYAFATLDVPFDTTLCCMLSGSGKAEIILNGKRIVPMDTLSAEEKAFPLHVVKGVNNIMLKTSRTGVLWDFSFCVNNFEVRNRKNRYRIIIR